MTWNIHGGAPWGGRRNLARVKEIVAAHDPDVVALQEVDSRRSAVEATSAFEELAEGLGTYAAHAKTIIAPDGEFGHMLISRFPFTGTSAHDISIAGRERRAVIDALIETPGGRLHVVAAHFGLGFAERRHQASLAAELTRADAAASIMLGDFNEWQWRGAVRRVLLKALPERTPERTFPAHLPLLSLDRIYGRPAGLIVKSFVDPAGRLASDHLPLIADLDLGAVART
ncbi:endonuclease/exonuclease/phosphatase family metal-dependent hydrolase [Rhodopseudomonas julia]|uniref:Endonuclease/exonuclease/phosphatase family metal-dependent hydrolase n=1 Tax=Rhodopseudomonas julia TaxID=200617 RepID=A0ABU0C3F6_9BRAD|nr:endonuclease/exonuclease/phosphatase family protein [Rhodopseudomonas julia]MDQ0325015.1 endonuclease/exonuclease/phosphatase family metal-dependent hydrolase [Rhodopseudomonas julia]